MQVRIKINGEDIDPGTKVSIQNYSKYSNLSAWIVILLGWSAAIVWYLLFQ